MTEDGKEMKIEDFNSFLDAYVLISDGLQSKLKTE
jgi:hypothetical protein